MSRLAVETCFWPLYEIENGAIRVTVKPKEKKPLVNFLKPQGRFKHLFSPENEWLLQQAQDEVDRTWERLLKEEALFGPAEAGQAASTAES
jgi:pyruvate ferredoxin oxidoreductase beta subunit